MEFVGLIGRKSHVNIYCASDLLDQNEQRFGNLRRHCGYSKFFHDHNRSSISLGTQQSSFPTSISAPAQFCSCFDLHDALDKVCPQLRYKCTG